MKYGIRHRITRWKEKYMRVSSTKVDNKSKVIALSVVIVTKYVEFCVEQGHTTDVCYLSEEEFNTLRYSYLFSKDTSETQNSTLGMKIIVEE